MSHYCANTMSPSIIRYVRNVSDNAHSFFQETAPAGTAKIVHLSSSSIISLVKCITQKIVHFSQSFIHSNDYSEGHHPNRKRYRLRQRKRRRPFSGQQNLSQHHCSQCRKLPRISKKSNREINSHQPDCTPVKNEQHALREANQERLGGSSRERRKPQGAFPRRPIDLLSLQKNSIFLRLSDWTRAQRF